LEIRKTNGSYWRLFKPHYYLDLARPIAAEYFVGFVDGEPVCHLAVTPKFNGLSYRATRLVVMPEWQGAGVGTKFLEWVCQYHLDGNGRKKRKFTTTFHTSHPQLISYLKRSPKWKQTSAVLYGGDKKKSHASITKANIENEQRVKTAGYGGHFRAVQGFRYIGE